VWIAVTVALVLGVAHTGYWISLRSQLIEGYAKWRQMAAQSGFKVEGEMVGGGGWPSSVTLELRNLAVEGAKGVPASEFAWRSERTVVRLSLITPRRLEIEPSGAQRFRIGPHPAFPVTWKNAGAFVLLSPEGGAETLTLVGNDISARLGPDRTTLVNIGLVQARSDLGPAADGIPFSLSTEAIDLPSGAKWPLGRRISSLSLEGKLTGKLSAEPTATEWANTWRDSGGALEVGKLALGWGPLGVSATATLALDDQLQPMGAGSARLIGYPAALDALASAGTLSRSAVVAGKAILSLLAPAPEDDAAGEVEVPLTLQYRTLSIRQVPLLRLPEVDWGQP
jgi:hypothetical protein